MTRKKLITAQDLSETLDLSVDTIWRYTREKKIPSVTLGSKQYRYYLDEVIEALSGTKLKEKKTAYRDDPDREYTYQDYVELPEEVGYKHEVLDGMLIKEPSPDVNHQRSSRNLQRILEEYFHENGGEVFNAPLDVTFEDRTIVQPDLICVTGEQRKIIKETRIDGAPTLLVEIISPTSIRKDRIQKYQIYQDNKVKNYWIVEPDQKIVECYSLKEGVYSRTAGGMEDEELICPAFPDLSIPLNKIWS